MWKSRLDGRTLHFHLAGINNQNFIMRDEETGTWWQQVSGCATFGPLAGRCLDPMPWDEVTFTVWKREHPRGQVLRQAEDLKDSYASPDWEKEIAGYPTVAPADPRDVLKPRDLIVGVTSGTDARAYSWTALAASRLIVDALGTTPLLIVLNPDGRSLRCFDRRLEGRTIARFAKTEACPPAIVDGDTGSEWDFSGHAIAGPLSGRRLARIICLKDYWFDWKNYNARTDVYAPPEAEPAPAPAP